MPARFGSKPSWCDGGARFCCESVFGNAGIRREVCRAMASASSSAMHVKPEHFPAAFPAKAPGPALAGPSSRKVAAPLEATTAGDKRQFPEGIVTFQ